MTENWARNLETAISHGAWHRALRLLELAERADDSPSRGDKPGRELERELERSLNRVLGRGLVPARKKERFGVGIHDSRIPEQRNGK